MATSSEGPFFRSRWRDGNRYVSVDFEILKDHTGELCVMDGVDGLTIFLSEQDLGGLYHALKAWWDGPV